jgi:CRP/FNR family transcriptional regulator, cyclic AMP receptor protein
VPAPVSSISLASCPHALATAPTFAVGPQPVTARSSSARAREDGLVRYRVGWNVLMPLRAAVLDDDFARSLARWPQAMSALLERAVRRTHRMSIHEALLQLSPVETRLVVLFWHLAERWGRVTPAGIVLRLRLSHALLGQLVGCKRASVTTALQHVYASGALMRRADGTWLLTGEPPDELTSIHWGAAATQA